MSTLETLQTLTEALPRAEREELGRRFGIEWTALRYQGTGSIEALELLAPFLNDSDVTVRRQALNAVGTVFSGTGPDGLEKLTYVTHNRDLFIRDRAACVVGRALRGSPLGTIVEALRSSYTHRNDFIRGWGALALGLACQGRADDSLLPQFAAAMSDASPLVPYRACYGLGLAYEETGSLDALAMLTSRGPWGYDQVETAVLFAVAFICRRSPAEARALAILGQQLPARVPHDGEGHGFSFVGRDGVSVMTWFLWGQVRQGLQELEYILTRPVPNRGWGRWSTRNSLIWCLPDVFVQSGDEGVAQGCRLVAAEGHPANRAGLLGLGLAARGTGRPDAAAAVQPFLTHGNGALRDAATLALGYLHQSPGQEQAAEMLRQANREDRRGPCTNYPLALGLLHQGTGDPGAAEHLASMLHHERQRLARHAALGIGLVYQGTGDPRAVELLLPMLEAGDLVAPAQALLLVDFDLQELAALPRGHGLSDGPGVASLFVMKHLVDAAPDERYTGSATHRYEWEV